MIDTKALREKVLDLAIRGKLVPQDPNDEPATVLLERIREQKKQMVQEGKLKAKDIKNDTVIFKGDDSLHYEKLANGTVKCIEDEIPFDVPEGWAWERLGNISTIARGGSPRPIKAFLTSDAKGVNWIKIGDTEKDGKYIFSTKERIKPEGVSKSRFVKSGDFLLTNSMSFGRPYILKTEGCIHDGWLVIGDIDLIFDQDYLYYALSAKYMYQTMSIMAGGSTVDNLNSDLVKSLMFPIPPINEQKYIARKVSDLLELVESIKSNEETIGGEISLIKAKILDLAIQGKLVPQDPNDEPASVLLDRILAEKEELIKQGKIKRNKKESFIYKGGNNSYYEKIGENTVDISDEVPFEIPKSWTFVRLDDVLDYEQPTPYIVKSTDYKDDYQTPVLTAGKSFIIGYTNETYGIKTELPVIIFDDFSTDSKYVDFPFKVKSSAMKILTAKENLINTKFAYYAMQVVECDNYNHKRYWISEFSKKLIPLPPKKEQVEIINAIEELYKYIEQSLS
mgnify:CR=1 FL=1